MPVYVDNARNPVGLMLMCHMIADSIEELLELADRIDVDRKHFQPWSSPHFDLSQSYRARAIEAGAIPVDWRKLVEVMHRAEYAAYERAMRASSRGKVRAAHMGW